MSSASTGGTEGSSPASSPESAASQVMAAPKCGTLVPNRIFVGGISANTSEAELAQLFSTYGNVKATKIIMDRGGVSKGYGFVTFETEEEAKRLQQDPEGIILRERKLNIAPAIKKQPFNRSFDGGSGSPPAVPTSPYYYPNGMGLPYQNGLTFYNAGAPAPGAALAPQTDPSALYQAAGVFGPQAASAHQTFAPMMYPCPAPSLYMPHQYQYSPMPYESYYTGAAGASPYLYTSGGAANGTVGPNAGQTTPGPDASPQTNHQFYAGSGPLGPGHHPGLQSGPAGGHQGLDPIYYSFSGPHQQLNPRNPAQHPNIGLGDQQLVLYTTECQQTANSDSQGQGQEESRSTSSNSQPDPPPHASPSPSISTTPLMSVLPLKYPLTPRYNYPPTMPPPTLSVPPTPPGPYQGDPDDAQSNPMHCRTVLYHPVFIQSAYSPPSLLPTPTPTPHKTPYTPQNSQNGFSLFSSIHQAHYPKSQLPKTQIRKSTNSYMVKTGADRAWTGIERSNVIDTRGQNLFGTPRIGGDAARRRNGAVGKTGDEGNGPDKNASPPPAPYSPMTRPLHNFSPTNIQMQFYSTQSRYPSGHSPVTPTMSQVPGHRRPQNPIGQEDKKLQGRFALGAQGYFSRNPKLKVNGICSKSLKEGIGAAGDTQHLQMTPPGTPRNSQDNQMADTCHQMQALTL